MRCPEVAHDGETRCDLDVGHDGLHTHSEGSPWPGTFVARWWGGTIPEAGTSEFGYLDSRRFEKENNQP